MIIVDSSVLIAAFRQKDKHHSVARMWLKENLHEELGIPRHALAEIAASFARLGEDESTIEEVLALVRDNFTIFEYDKSLSEAAIDICKKCRVRGADSIFIALAQTEGAKLLITLDREQAERGSIATPTKLLG